jgi:hypothetical protein
MSVVLGGVGGAIGGAFRWLVVWLLVRLVVPSWRDYMHDDMQRSPQSRTQTTPEHTCHMATKSHTDHTRAHLSHGRGTRSDARMKDENKS